MITFRKNELVLSIFYLLRTTNLKILITGPGKNVFHPVVNPVGVVIIVITNGPKDFSAKNTMGTNYYFPRAEANLGLLERIDRHIVLGVFKVRIFIGDR
ncbi:hypothetical protein DGG96_03665 [Legionella qingyii]|uniref:Uncharacterized protein n=1 Tax=Legionella qingyii TaxID=2184757 RepID=A0A317U862_9GAMM|nr:hypothetical protein DGG96_03665 [Legionella qingyii]